MDRYGLVLASASPRRKRLLDRMGLRYTVEAPQIDESAYFGGAAEDIPPEQAVGRLAEEKVKQVLRTCPHHRSVYIVGADTVILCDGEIIGKPESREHAESLFYRYSGAKQRVFTGVALYSPQRGTGGNGPITRRTAEAGRIDRRTTETDVFFARLTDEDIEWYLDTDEWEGVAGGYRIQERGACLIERIEGSYSNVMGLPIRTFYGMLRAVRFPFSSVV